MKAHRKRPLGVTLVIVIAMVQAGLLGLAAAAVFAARREVDVQASLEATERTLVAIAGLLAVAALVNLVLGIGLARRVGVVRSIYAMVATIEAGIAVYSLVALRDIRAGSVWGFAFPALVLWFLYGSDRTRAYFDA